MSELHECMQQLVDQMDEDLKKFPYSGGDDESEEGYKLWLAQNALAKLTIRAKLDSVVDNAAVACLKHLREHVGPNLDYTSATEILTTVISGLEERKQNGG